jgi:Skp family chaperone for outer membrane proteins
MSRFILYSLGCLLLFVAGASAQPATAPPTKIGIANSSAFMDEKTGIVRLINSVKALNTEFGPLTTELQGMSKRLDTLAKEVESLRTQTTNGVPVDEKALQAKYDEAEKLQRDLKFKQEDAQRRFEKRRQTLVGPVMDDVGKALNEFAKQNHYTLIFDIAKDDVGLLVAVGDDKVNVTKDFITYYNAKPIPPTTAK